MPRGDGTGPPGGSGPGTGRNRGMRTGGGGSGRKRGTKAGAGPGGNCVCPKCGAVLSHQVGIPCYDMKCSKCGASMVRE